MTWKPKGVLFWGVMIAWAATGNGWFGLMGIAVLIFA